MNDLIAFEFLSRIVEAKTRSHRLLRWCVVHSNYRGELFANVVNSSEADFKVDVGDRVCQLAIQEAPVIKLIPVDELSNTERGAAGFGSSGLK